MIHSRILFGSFCRQLFRYFFLLSVALAACPTNCFSCSTDGTTCLGPDGRTARQTDPYERFCKDGFYGANCNQNCSAGCIQPYCSLLGYCMATPTRTPGSDFGSAGTHDRAVFCKDGLYWAGCTFDCPKNCAQAYCSASGYCMATPTRTPGSDFGSAGSYDKAIYCRDGFFGGNTCDHPCPKNCAHHYCSAQGYCMATHTRTPGSDYSSAEPYDRAIFCKDSFFGGNTCANSCPTNCSQAYCSADGYCMATPTRTPGSDYETAGTYDQAIFCKDGLYGNTCDERCPGNCANSFCSAYGLCMATPTRRDNSDYGIATDYERAIFCKDGFYNSDCSHTCSANCSRPYCSKSGYCMATPARAAASDIDSADKYDPPTCRTDLGQCSWYASCLQKSTPDACPAIANVMQAKCAEYQTLEPSLSTAGQEWSKSARACVQSQLATLWTAGTFGTLRCEVIQSEFFGDPLPCLLKNGPVSFCDLPVMDTIQIMLHGNNTLVSNNWWYPSLAGAQLQARCWASYYQVNAIPRRNADSLLQSHVEADLRQFFQSRFGPQGWNADIMTINGTKNHALALGFLPNTTVATSSPRTRLAPYFITEALAVWAKTSTGSNYLVSINEPLGFTAAAAAAFSATPFADQPPKTPPPAARIVAAVN